MKSELEKILETVPTEVPWSEIVDFDKFDERQSAVSVLYSNTIGVCENYIEFCPDYEPPQREEILSWIWAFRPDLADEILEMNLSEDFKILLESYNSSEMQKFWDYVS